MATLNHVLDSYGILEDKDPWDVFKQVLVNFKVDSIQKLKDMEASMVARIFHKCGIAPEKLSQFEKTIILVTDDDSWEGFGGNGQDDAKEHKVKKERGGMLPNSVHFKNRPPNAHELAMYTLPSLSGMRGPYEGLLKSLPRCVIDVASRIRPDTTHITWEMGQWLIAERPRPRPTPRKKRQKWRRPRPRPTPRKKSARGWQRRWPDRRRRQDTQPLRERRKTGSSRANFARSQCCARRGSRTAAATSARMAPPARNASMRSEKPPETRQWAPSTGRSARSRSDPSGTLVGP